MSKSWYCDNCNLKLLVNKVTVAFGDHKDLRKALDALPCMNLDPQGRGIICEAQDMPRAKEKAIKLKNLHNEIKYSRHLIRTLEDKILDL